MTEGEDLSAESGVCPVADDQDFQQELDDGVGEGEEHEGEDRKGRPDNVDGTARPDEMTQVGQAWSRGRQELVVPCLLSSVALSVRAPSISRHLAILKAAGLVVERREGNRILYRLQENRLLSALGDFISTVCPAQNILRVQERQRRGEG